jgi:hypothetical protein
MEYLCQRKFKCPIATGLLVHCSILMLMLMLLLLLPVALFQFLFGSIKYSFETRTMFLA